MDALSYASKRRWIRSQVNDSWQNIIAQCSVQESSAVDSITDFSSSPISVAKCSNSSNEKVNAGTSENHCITVSLEVESKDCLHNGDEFNSSYDSDSTSESDFEAEDSTLASK